MRKTADAALAVLLLASPAAAAPAPAALFADLPAVQPQPLAGDPLQATIHRLSNGLTVYLSPNKQTPRVSAWIAVRAGSKNDPADNTGLAHYLEHMLFKGTPSLGTVDYAAEKVHLDRIAKLYDEHARAKDPAERARIYERIDRESVAAAKLAVPNEIADVYDQLGLRGLNAFTSDEATVYLVDVPANRLEAWAAMEAERLARPVFRLFQSELEAVYEEKNRSLDNAERILGEALNRALYKKHPYGQQTTIGEIEHLKNPSLTSMYEYYRRWYVPNNMAIALAGDFEPKATLSMLERTFGWWRPKPLPPPQTWPLPPPDGVERVETVYEAEEKVVIAWPTVPYRHPDADALTVMDMLMDNAVAGLINLELNQAQKVKAAGSGPAFYNDAGDWEMWALPKRGQTLDQAEALLMETVGHLKEGRFTEEDIRAVVTAFEVHEKLRLESNDARVGMMADSFLRRQPWPEAASRLERLRKITRDDVLRVAREYIGENRVVAYRRKGKPALPSIAKPAFTKVDIAKDRASSFARKILAMPAGDLEPRWLVEGRDYATLDADAGRIVAARNPFNDLFSLTFVFDRGSRHERKLCAALSLLELSGAGDLTAEQLKKKLFGLGTSVSYGCGERESSVSISGLDEHLWESLRLVALRFDQPRVDEATLKSMVDVAIGAHQDTKKDPRAVFHALGDFARRGKDSGVLNDLTDKELESLKLGDLTALMRSFPRFERRIGYVGNRPLGELAKLLEQREARRKSPERPRESLARPAKTRVLFAHRDMVQAQLGVFAADEPYDLARAADYRVLSEYLDGGMSSLLFQEIREARSLAYAVWGGYRRSAYKGDDSELSAGLGCQADKVLEAAALLPRLTFEPPLQAERLASVRRALEQNFRTNPIQFRAVPGALMSWQNLGLPAGDPRPAQFERVRRYTLDDLRAFTSRFRGRPYTLYVLGHRDRVDLKGLQELGVFEEKKIDDLFPY